MICSWRSFCNTVDCYLCVLCWDDGWYWIPSQHKICQVEWHSISHWYPRILLCRPFSFSKYLPIYGWQNTIYQSINCMVWYPFILSVTGKTYQISYFWMSKLFLNSFVHTQFCIVCCNIWRCCYHGIPRVWQRHLVSNNIKFATKCICLQGCNVDNSK